MLLHSTTAEAQRRTPPVTPPVPRLAARRDDTTIKNTTLEVYQLYQPELKPIVKPELSPVLPPPPASPAPQQYEVPQQTLYYAYRALPLRPLALGRDSLRREPQKYVLIAGGNLATILGEAGIGGIRGRDWQSTVGARYITQNSDLQGQVFRSAGLDADGTLQRSNHLFEAGINAYRNVFGRYGFDHDAHPSYSFDDLKTVYSAASLSIGARNTLPGPWELDYHPQARFDAFDASRSGRETTLDILLPATKHLDSALSISLALNSWLAWTTIGSKTSSNNVAQVAPALDYRKEHFILHLGLYPTFAEGESVRLLPDLTADFRFAGGAVKATAGWQSRYIQNTLQQLSIINPFTVFSPYDRVRTRRSEVFGGLSFALGHHLSVWGRAAWQRNEGLPLFITAPGGDGKDMRILYDDDVNALMGAGGVRYAIGDGFSAGAEGAWYNYYHHTYTHVWGEPAVRLKGDISWKAIQGLLLTAYAEVLDGIWGQDAAGNAAKLRGVFDLGAGGEYSFGSGFSGILRADNLLGRRNERWLGYPSFGFNIYGGLRYRF